MDQPIVAWISGDEETPAVETVSEDAPRATVAWLVGVYELLGGK